ncbi:hypothetical protein, partial [Shewanella indica]
YFSPEQAQWLEWSFVERFAHLFSLILGGALGYFMALVLFGIRPWRLKARN